MNYWERIHLARLTWGFRSRVPGLASGTLNQSLVLPTPEGAGFGAGRTHRPVTAEEEQESHPAQRVPGGASGANPG